MKVATIPALLLAALSLSLSACNKLEGELHGEEQGHEEHNRIVVTTPVAKDVINTQQYVCQIHSRRHIEVRALESGYLEKISVNEGQAVNEGDLMFKIVPVLYQAKLDSEAAEAQLVQIELNNTQALLKQNVV